jgi:hypothetical protein
MAKFRITDNQSGKTLTISGDKAPSEQEAEELFKSSGIREQAQPQGSTQKPFDLMGLLQSSVQSGIQNAPQNALVGGGPIPTALFGRPEQKAVAVAGPAVGAASLMAAPAITGALATKSLSPIKIASWLRDQAAGKAGQINTQKLIEAGDKYTEINPLAKEVWNIFKPTITGSMSAKDLLNRMTQVFGQAYTRSGSVKDSAQGELMNQLYQGGKTALQQQAPEVAKYTSGMKQILTAPKQLQNITWLLAKLGLAKGAF